MKLKPAAFSILKALSDSEEFRDIVTHHEETRKQIIKKRNYVCFLGVRPVSDPLSRTLFIQAAGGSWAQIIVTDSTDRRKHEKFVHREHAGLPALASPQRQSTN